jgi:hypothetical protein
MFQLFGKQQNKLTKSRNPTHRQSKSARSAKFGRRFGGWVAMLFMQGLWCHIECLRMPYGIFEQRSGMLSTHTGVAISWDWTDIIAKDEQGVSERVNVRKVNAVNAHTRRTESEAWAHEATVRAAG